MRLFWSKFLHSSSLSLVAHHDSYSPVSSLSISISCLKQVNAANVAYCSINLVFVYVMHVLCICVCMQHCLGTKAFFVAFCSIALLLLLVPDCCSQLQSWLSCRIVVVAMVISLGGVVMIGKPSFLFGGQGINKTGLVLALMQVGLLFTSIHSQTHARTEWYWPSCTDTRMQRLVLALRCGCCSPMYTHIYMETHTCSDTCMH